MQIYQMGINKSTYFDEMLATIEKKLNTDIANLTHITLTPLKAILIIECSIIGDLFKALLKLQHLEYISALAAIHSAHTKITAWESKIQNRETWKLGFLKNTQLPALFQWHQKFKGAVLSKFSFLFHDKLASQTNTSEMKQICSKLHIDYYNKIYNFHKKI